MASSALDSAELDRLLAEVDQLSPEQVKDLAAKAMAEKEKRKKYHSTTNLSPEERVERRKKQHDRNIQKRERNNLILKRAREMGIDIDKIKKEVASNG